MKKTKLMIAVLLAGMICPCVCADESMPVPADETAAESDASDEYSTGYTYEELASDPESLTSQKIRVTGKIIEVSGSCPAINRNAPGRWFRLCMDNDTHNILFISFEDGLVDHWLLDDDRMVVDGVVRGTYDYESPSGAVRTLPWISADRMERTGTHDPIVRSDREVELLYWKNGAILGEYVPAG